jgi:hypothetical protein
MAEAVFLDATALDDMKRVLVQDIACLFCCDSYRSLWEVKDVTNSFLVLRVASVGIECRKGCWPHDIRPNFSGIAPDLSCYVVLCRCEALQGKRCKCEGSVSTLDKSD